MVGKQGQGVGVGGSLGIQVKDHRLGGAGDRSRGSERPETSALPVWSRLHGRSGPSAD